MAKINNGPRVSAPATEAKAAKVSKVDAARAAPRAASLSRPPVSSTGWSDRSKATRPIESPPQMGHHPRLAQLQPQRDPIGAEAPRQVGRLALPASPRAALPTGLTRPSLPTPHARPGIEVAARSGIRKPDPGQRK